MAEMPLIPLAPAVSAAVFDAVGVWFDELPLTPERISAGLQSKQHGPRPAKNTLRNGLKPPKQE